MKKELKIRTQKLTKKLPPEATAISSAIHIKPDEQEQFEKKGSLYAVFDIKSENVVDPLLVKKIISDVLSDSYYSSESASPIQALERAIVDVKNKVSDLSGIEKNDAKIKDFNILVAAFWGNVVYMVQFGKGGSFLVRDNSVKPVNSATEGKFSVASGVVKDSDVIFLGTQSFVDKNQVEDLIGGKSSVSMRDLDNTASAVLLKFELDAKMTQEEKVDFGLRDEKTEPASKQSVSTIDLAKKSPASLPKISIESIKNKSFPFKIAIPAALVLILAIFGFINKDNIANMLGTSEEAKPQEQEVVVDEGEVNGESTEEQLSDEELLIERVNPEVFYDLAISDEQTNPTDITVLDSEVFVADRNSGQLFVSSATTPGFDETAQFPGIRSMSYFGGNLVFVDDEGYKIYEKPVGEEGSVIETYEGENLQTAKPYLTFLYSVEGNEIIKYQLLETGLEESTWAQAGEIEGARSVAIDGNIYVLKENELLKYYTGDKEDFEIEGLNTPLSDAVKVVKSFDFENIYIADSGNNRILVLNEDGILLTQYRAEEGKFDDIRSISVSPNEDTLYVLSGTQVFDISLVE